MSRICLYFIRPPEQDRWLPGDRYIRPLVRRVVRGKPPIGGVDRVFVNLCLGLDRLGIKYEVNLPFNQLREGDRVGILGRCNFALKGYNKPNPIVAGPVLMTSPSEWPNLCEEYPVVKYIQHSEWARQVYVQYYGEERCGLWPVGIETDIWQATPASHKSIDFLIYNKVRWQHEYYEETLLTPLRKHLMQRGLSFEELRYGSYRSEDYKAALSRCRAMIFICEHESQGIAYQEALSSDVPILAWDQGWCLDPYFYKDGQPYLPATSVPFWDSRCGVKFKDIEEFPVQLEEFLYKLQSQAFTPRDYILEHLTLERCSRQYLDILEKANQINR